MTCCHPARYGKETFPAVPVRPWRWDRCVVFKSCSSVSVFLCLISGWCSQTCQHARNVPSGRAGSGVTAGGSWSSAGRDAVGLCSLRAKPLLLTLLVCRYGAREPQGQWGGVRSPLEGVRVYLCRSWTNPPAQGVVEVGIDAAAGKKVACFVDKWCEIDVARGWCCSVSCGL